jgi:hypothetical protein
MDEATIEVAAEDLHFYCCVGDEVWVSSYRMKTHREREKERKRRREKDHHHLLLGKTKQFLYRH